MKKFTPPKFADKFFKWYCRNDLFESILGDLHEQFYYDLDKKGIFKARLFYWITVLKFFNRFTTKSAQRKTSHIVIRDYIKTPLRFLLKHKSYALINIAGLSIGLFSCLLIFYFLHHELTFDQQHERRNQIYRVNMIYSDNSGSETTFINSAPALVPGIKGLFPEVEKASRLRYTLRASLRKDGRVFYEDHGFYADSTFLELFSFPLISGNPNVALDEPNTIVITSSLAEKYFGEEDPMGKFLTMNNDLLLKVTGVLEPIPTNSHLKFNFLVSFSTYTIPSGYRSDLTSWSWMGFLTYVQLKEEADANEFEKKLNAHFQELDPENEAPFRTIVQPLDDIYLGSSEMTDDLASNMRGGSKYSVYSLAIIATLILFIATFNLMNLTSATSLTRGREVGIKKILGAEKGKLVVQLLLESVLITILSTLMAYFMLILLFPNLQQILNWDFEIGYSSILTSLPFVLIFTVVLGVLAGISPAILLSNLRGSKALKQGLNSGRSGNKFSNALISIQFMISVFLISSTIVIYKQLKHLQDQSLGFETSNVISAKLLRRDMGDSYQRFKDELQQNSQIQSVSRSERIVGEPWPVNSILVNGQDESYAKQVSGNQVGYDFLKTMGIRLKAGRAFSEEFSADSLGSIIINESCAKYLGLDNPIGARVNYFSIGGPRTIVGVMEDFNFSSLHTEIGPAVVTLPFVDLEQLYVRVSPGNIAEQLDIIESQWSEITNGAPFEMHLMSDHVAQLYQREKQLSVLITSFSILAVSLACLGLYGLIAFTVNKKLKEVGIRKVLGASVTSLMILFSKRFMILIVIASIVAAPAIYYILNFWLTGFAYRIEVDVSVLVIASTLLAMISLFTIGSRTIRTALTNPVNALRDE